MWSQLSKIVKEAGLTHRQLLRKQQLWNETLGEDQAPVAHAFPDGWSIRRLMTPHQECYEGEMMPNCVGSADTLLNRLPQDQWHQRTSIGSDPEHTYYSVRDPDNVPHATFAHSPSEDKRFWDLDLEGRISGNLAIGSQQAERYGAEDQEQRWSRPQRYQDYRAHRQAHKDNHDDQGGNDVEHESGKIAGESPTTSWHLTDNPQFALDPEYQAANNTTLGGQWPHKGLFVGDPNYWFSHPEYHYVRPFAAEIEHPPLKPFGGYGGEGFVPAEAFPQSRIKRVIPMDEYVREAFGEPGHVESHFGESPEIPPGYRYQGPDVRQMSPEEVAHHQDRVNQYFRAMHPEAFPADVTCPSCRDPDWTVLTHNPNEFACQSCGGRFPFDQARQSACWHLAETDANPYEAQLWHGSQEGLLGAVRTPFWTTSHEPEAQGFGDVVHPVSVRFKRPMHTKGNIGYGQMQYATQNGYDGIVAHFGADPSDSFEPLPSRTWAIALDPGTVVPGHNVSDY